MANDVEWGGNAYQHWYHSHYYRWLARLTSGHLEEEMNRNTQWQLIYTALVQGGMGMIEAGRKANEIVAARWEYVEETDTTESVEGTLEAEAGEEQESAEYELPGIAEDRLPAEEN